MRAHRVPVHPARVVGRGGDAGQRLERGRAVLPAPGRDVGGGAELVGRQLGEQLGPRPLDADVRAEPLVGRAGERVAAERGDVDRAVRRRVDGVDVHARARGVGGGDDAGQVRDRADRVGGVGDRDPACAVGEHGLHRARGQLERLRVGLGEAHRRAVALGVDDPRGDVGVVVEPRADDLVAGLERAADGAGERHRQRGHREAEDDLRGRRAEQRAGARAGGLDELVGGVRGGEHAALVGPRPERIQAAIASIALSTICVPAGPSSRVQVTSARPGNCSRFIRGARPRTARARGHAGSSGARAPRRAPASAAGRPRRWARSRCRPRAPSASSAPPCRVPFGPGS